MSSKCVIVIPAYNCEPYVAATLNSLMEQGPALRQIDRIILADDYSMDRTIEIAKATWNGPVPLEVLRGAKNRGEYANVNECVKSIPDHIEWFLIMHADNLAKAGWLEALLGRVRVADKKIGTICTSWDNLRENGDIVPGENREPNVPERIVGDLASVIGTIRKGCWWHISSCAIRVETFKKIGGLPLGLKLKGDWDFLIRLLSDGWDVEYIPRALMTYRENPAGSSSVSFRRHHDIYETLDVTHRYQHRLPVWIVINAHAYHLKVLFRRFTGGLLRAQFERALACIPTAGVVFKSLLSYWHDRWIARRKKVDQDYAR